MYFFPRKNTFNHAIKNCLGTRSSFGNGQRRSKIQLIAPVVDLPIHTNIEISTVWCRRLMCRRFFNREIIENIDIFYLFLIEFICFYVLNALRSTTVQISHNSRLTLYYFYLVTTFHSMDNTKYSSVASNVYY